MTEHADRRPPSGPRRGPVEPLSHQAWHRIETAVFTRLDAAAVPWSLTPGPLHSYAAPRNDRPLRLHWATSIGLALASAAAAASALHYLRPPPVLEAGLPAELGSPTPPAPARAPQPPMMSLSVSLQPITPQPITPQPMAPATRRAPLPPAHLVPVPPARPSARRELDRPARSDRERLFARAASLETANAPLALALYLSLAGGDDAWAANALYAAARLEIDRGLREAGSGHLDEYLARFPEGENAVDVSGLRRRARPSP